MAKINKEGWSRTPKFVKYYGSVFGITKSGNLYRIDIGNERMQINENEVINISECQILLDEEAFNKLYQLMGKAKKETKKNE